MKNEQVCIHAIDDDKIILENEVGEVPIKDFWEYLRPAYCITTHKAQGDTFKEDYSIWEWFRMDKEMRYTALTRAQSLRQIHFRK
jgi:ATP-dependent exoDNAse (exonuclease V) alpha subunit